jgi:hypothetical protein
MTWQGHMTWVHIVREVFPDATDAQAWDILWRLGYPSFDAPNDSERVTCCRSKLAALENKPTRCQQ